MSKSLPAIFQEEGFWYKIGVDYEAAEEEVKDEESDTESLQDALLSRFVKRKRKIITDDYESVTHFKNSIAGSDDPKPDLLRLFAETEWFRKTDGTHFQSDQEVEEVILDLADNNAVVTDRVNEDFEILWPGNNSILKEIDEETEKIEASKHLQATPIVIKKTDDGFEVRGTGKHKNRIVGSLKERDDLTEEKPEAVSESVINQFNDLLDGENDHFKVTGVKFSQSNLPKQSQLTIKSDESVYTDIAELREKEIISIEGASELHTLFFRDKKLGNSFRVRVNKGKDGFQLTLKALNSKDYERDDFKKAFAQYTGINFKKVYEYSSQDERYLFNQILTGSEIAFQKYSPVLDDEVREVLNEFITVEEKQVRSCTEDGCNMIMDASDDRCSECRSSHLTDPFLKTDIDINDKKVASAVESALSNLQPSHDDLTIADWKLRQKTMSSRPVVESKFNQIDHVSAGRITNEEVYFIPQGTGQRPSRVNEYLLDAVYVTHGGSVEKNYLGYGQVQLYDLLFSERPEEYVGSAILDTAKGLRDRVRSKASDAQEKGDQYFKIWSRFGKVIDAKDQLERIYEPSQPNYFEKHIFYLLKDMFVLSERWGKEGKRLSDGAIICSKPDNSDYYVASYDAKLSHRKDGYPLSTEIEDQATRYIMANRDRSRIENKTNDEGPYAHIFISQNLKSSQFSKAAKNIRQNQDLFAGKADTEVVYLEFEALLGLHKIYLDYWRELQDNRVRKTFNGSTISELQKREEGEQYVHFNSDSVSSIRSAIIERLRNFADDPILRYSDQ